MGKLSSVWDKVKDKNLTKSWHYLVYLYLVLYALLFVLALLLGTTFGALFHNYGLYIIRVFPNLSTFTGVVGLGIAVFFAGWAIKRRDWLDLGLTLALVAANFAFFYFECNYYLLRFIQLPVASGGM